MHKGSERFTAVHSDSTFRFAGFSRLEKAPHSGLDAAAGVPAAQHKGDRNAKSLVAKKVAPTGSDVQKTSEAKSWTKPEKNANWANDYVQRMYGFIVPDVSGDYVFYVAGDDSATLFLSTDETPAKAKAIARTSAWTNPKQFTKSPSQKSAPVKLEKGKKYYVEAVMFEGAGGDNLSFAWVVPGKNAPEIISEKNLKTMK